MSLHAPSKPPVTEKKGILATAGGLGLLLTGIFAATACCWAPALIIGLGLGSVFGALHGARWYLMAAGALLVVGGVVWQIRKKRHGSCDC